MSQACNKIVPTDDDLQMDTKNSSMKVAAGEQYLASAQLSLAAYQLEQFGSAQEVKVHLRAATYHLERSIGNYDKALSLLRPAKITEEAKNWLREFDYDRFFSEKVASQSLLNRPDIWAEIATWTKAAKPSESILSLRNQLAAVMETLKSANDKNLLETIRKTVSGLAEAQIFGTVAAVLNDVTPLDTFWISAGIQEKVMLHSVKEARA
ncbi:MAG: hypothetical protein IVW51_06410 [Thermaceae bacterium]|nr:hypothetical protein [Thermaceae bacterium]